jgi:KDO2-lipid IV(A) lauroyltransferase
LQTRSALRNYLEAAVALIILWSLEWAPISLANRLGRFYAGVLDRLIPRLRRTAYANLSFAYPDRDDAWRRKTVDGIYDSIARTLVAFARFPRLNRRNIHDWIRYDGFEHFEIAMRHGRGVLFATAHLGNWELSAFAHALLSQPMNVVVRPLDNPLLDAIIERRRRLSGNALFSKRDFARSILHALRRNEAVGILVDQNSSADSGVFVPFFGQAACAGVTFSRLAARSGATVIPGFAFWSSDERRYVLKFYPAVPITGDADDDTARVQRAIENAVREHPEQWLWIHRRWKTRPKGAEPIY